VEGIANPLSRIGDLEEVVSLSKDYGLISVIDNTIPTPYNFKAVEFGFDLSLHSCTKYLNGHSDIVAGGILGSAYLIEKISHTLLHFGGTLDPHTCYLLERGLKTFPLRMKYQNESALRIADFLQGHPKVRVVHFPGLECHPDHHLAKKLFSGYSGFMSFELNADLYQTKVFIRNLTIPIESVSLGGPETLIIQPAATTHSLVDPETRRKMGITDTLIRLSVGLEDTDDLIRDISTALVKKAEFSGP
jgi:cystathionine beta-lyase/cystathionine gamma-synthase